MGLFICPVYCPISLARQLPHLRFTLRNDERSDTKAGALQSLYYTAKPHTFQRRNSTEKQGRRKEEKAAKHRHDRSRDHYIYTRGLPGHHARHTTTLGKQLPAALENYTQTSHLHFPALVRRSLQSPSPLRRHGGTEPPKGDACNS